MKQKSLGMGGEANTGHQRTQSAMLVLPSDITCNLTPEEENVLARQIAEQGDESATVRLYCCCLTSVYYYFYRKTWGDVQETENLTQDTLLRTWQGLCNGTWTGDAFRPWLRGITRNVFREWMRDNPKQSSHTEHNGSHPVDETEQTELIAQIDLLDDVLIKERGTTLWGLVRELPEQDRLVLFLRYYRGFHYTEIAPLLKCAEGACKTRHWRALEHLREKIVQAGLSEELGLGKGKEQIT